MPSKGTSNSTEATTGTSCSRTCSCGISAIFISKKTREQRQHTNGTRCIAAHGGRRFPLVARHKIVKYVTPSYAIPRQYNN